MRRWTEFINVATALLVTHVCLELFTELLAYQVHGAPPSRASRTAAEGGAATTSKPALPPILTPGEIRQRGHVWGYFLIKAIKQCKLRWAL